MPKSITNSTSYNSKNVKNSNTVTAGDIKSGNIICTNLTATNATITNLTNSQLTTNTNNISTNSTNISTNTSNISTNTSNISTNTTAISANASAISTNTTNIAGKQDTITSSTSLSCGELNLNTNKLINGTSIQGQSLELSGSNNLSFVDFGSGDFRFRIIYNEGDNTAKFFIDDTNGENPEVKIRIERTKVAFPFSDVDLNSNDIINVNSLNTITSTEIGYLDGVTSSIQTQLDSKLTGGGAASFSSLNLNSGNLTNGGTGNFSSINLNGSDLQGKIDDKANTFVLTMPLEIAGSAIRLNFKSTQFQVNASDELELIGLLPTLTTDLNMGNNDIVNVENVTSASAISFFANGETIASDNFSLKLRSDGNVKIKSGNLDMTSNAITNVSEVEGSVRIMEFGADPDSVSSNQWGDDHIHDTWATSIDVNGSGMITESSGIFTIVEAGTYTITVNAVVEDQSYANRIVAGMYLSLNDDTSRFRGTTSGTSFALCYLRFDDYGFGESMTFSLTEVFSASDTIRFKTKLGTAGDARNYNDTLDDDKLKWWAGVRFQKLLRA